MADMYFHRIGLIDYLKEKSLTKFNSFYKGYVEAIKDVIAYEPTEIQSVVHCKDCKYAQNPNDTMVYCTYFECGTMSQNDFCSQGERTVLRNERAG